MLDDRRIPRIKIFILALLMLVLLPICVVIYSTRSNSYSFDKNYPSMVRFTNPEVIQDWLPNKSVEYTNARLNDFVTSTNSGNRYSSFTILGGVTNYDGTYTFQVEFLPTEEVHQVSVRIINYSSILSMAVYVDGVLQEPPDF